MSDTSLAMQSHRTLVPFWAVTNTALLLGPSALGVGIFRLWFVPRPVLLYAALGLMFIYYPIAILVSKHTSRAEYPWAEVGKKYPTLRSRVFAVIGGVMFLALGYAAFYVSIPALLTQLAGRDVSRQVTVEAAYPAYRTMACRYEIRFKEMSPPLGGGFCLSSRDFDHRWVKGSTVTLVGRESSLGFRFTEISARGAALERPATR